MKFLICILIVIFQLCTIILASPPTGGIGDGYIYPVKQTASNPKTTTTYYAKPLHPPVKKPALSGPKKPKPEVFKVIIQNQPAPNQGGGSSSGGGAGKSVKIFKVKQPKSGHGGGCSK